MPEPRFPHAVASFDPTADGVLLWTCVEGADEVAWWVATDPEGEDVAARGTVPVADVDGCVTVAAEGLEPGRTYCYGFRAGPVRSAVGRTRTLPDGPVDELRLGLVCCADVTAGHFAAYRSVAEDELDLVVHLGDYIYEGEAKGSVRPHPEPEVAVAEEDYRARYASARADPDLQALHLRHPVTFVWDDHDVADNAWRDGAKAHDPDRHGDWGARLGAATRARQAWVPARLRDPDEPLAMWRSLPAGDLAELVVLDTRIPGRDRQAGDEGARPLRDPERSLLGAAQRRWAHERIADRTRPWSIVASAVVLHPMRLPIAPADVDVLDPSLPSGYGVVDGDAVCTDEWDGYPAERDALVASMARRGGGVVVVSGDVHSSWAFEGPRDDDGRPVAVELVCPSVTSTPMARQLPPGWERLADRLADAADGARWSDLRSWGWLRLSITPERVTGEWWGVDPEAVGVERELLAAWSTAPSLPARLTEVSGPLADLPARPGPPVAALPPRPEGLARRRGAHRLLAAAATAGVAAVGLAAAAWWWRRRAAGLPDAIDVALDRLPVPPGR